MRGAAGAEPPTYGGFSSGRWREPVGRLGVAAGAEPLPYGGFHRGGGASLWGV